MIRICFTTRPATELSADAIIVFIDKDGVGTDGVHNDIKNLVGNHFHNNISAFLPLSHDSVVVVPRTQMYPIRFDAVIFAVDCKSEPIEALLLRALIAADKQHMRVLSISAPRIDTSSFNVDESFETTCMAIRKAVDQHHYDFPNSRLNMINVVIGKHRQLLERAINCS